MNASLIVTGSTEAIHKLQRTLKPQVMEAGTHIYVSHALIPDALGNDPMTAHSFVYLKDAMEKDSNYAWAWHCNLAVAFLDGGKADHEAANRGAALFMERCFNVDVSKFAEFKSLETQWTALAA